jgi:hypothetical protein
MAWVTPKVDWDADDVIGDADFNRIEGNCDYLKGLVDYETQGDFIMTFPITTVYSAEQTVAVHWWKRRVTGSLALVTLAFTTAVTGTSASALLFGTGLPEAIRPSTGIQPFVITIEGEKRPGLIEPWDAVNSRTNFWLYNVAALGIVYAKYEVDSFPTSGEKGFPIQSVTYHTST